MGWEKGDPNGRRKWMALEGLYFEKEQRHAGLWSGGGPGGRRDPRGSAGSQLGRGWAVSLGQGASGAAVSRAGRRGQGGDRRAGAAAVAWTEARGLGDRGHACDHGCQGTREWIDLTREETAWGCGEGPGPRVRAG